MPPSTRQQDHLPDVGFFVKDRQSRLMGGNRAMLDRLGLETEADLVGRNDDDFFPAHMANRFRADDQIVFLTGEPVINNLEVWNDEKRDLNRYYTTKLPLRGKNGTIVGLMGISRRDARQEMLHVDEEFAKVLQHLQQNTHRILSTDTLARECGMSERSLFRKIKQAVGVTPYELALRIRIQKAAEALTQTCDKVDAIARAHGFCNQSTFTQHFRKRTGMTPKEFRIRYRG